MPEDPVLDDLKGLSEEDLLKEIRKPFSRLGRLLLGLFILLIFLPFLFPGDFLTILEGRLDSARLSPHFTAPLEEGGRVLFDQGVYESLRRLYREHPRTEIKVCLLGDKLGRTYHVTGIYEPETYAQSVFSVTAENCPPNTIIALHTHPYRHCLLSVQDIQSYEASRRIHPEALVGVMCEESRFSFYGG